MFRAVVRNLSAISVAIGVALATGSGNYDLAIIGGLIFVATGLDQIDQTLADGFERLSEGQDRALEYAEHGIELEIGDDFGESGE
jgi:hypothetical protein